MALLFISHDITVVGQVCDRVLVMYAGKIVENLPTADLADHARHPYTRALLAAVPSMETSRELPLAVIPGRPADPADLPAGCAFAARCAFADAKCRQADPPSSPTMPGARSPAGTSTASSRVSRRRRRRGAGRRPGIGRRGAGQRRARMSASMTAKMVDRWPRYRVAADPLSSAPPRERKRFLLLSEVGRSADERAAV